MAHFDMRLAFTVIFFAVHCVISSEVYYPRGVSSYQTYRRFFSHVPLIGDSLDKIAHGIVNDLLFTERHRKIQKYFNNCCYCQDGVKREKELDLGTDIDKETYDWINEIFFNKRNKELKEKLNTCCYCDKNFRDISQTAEKINARRNNGYLY